MFYAVAWPSPPSPPPGRAQQPQTAPLAHRGNGPAPVAPTNRVAFSTATPRDGTAILRQGSQGEGVKYLQTRLGQLTYDPGPIDGHFGPRTDQAVRRFQGANALPADGVVGPATWAHLGGGPSAVPKISPALPQLQFHPIARLAPGPDGKGLGLLAIGLAGAALTAYRFRPDRPKPTAQLPIHYPQPVYPQGAGVIHQPQPVYPPPVDSIAAAPGDLSPDPAPHPECLPEFLYDLQEPQQRQALTAALQGTTTVPALAALLNRLGSFPPVHHRTGRPYTYLLLDDLGGCFRLCNHELWVTEAALQWLSQNMPYTLTIRRLDSNGGVEDREFTVALSPRELAVAA